jgi:IS30 family transposase
MSKFSGRHLSYEERCQIHAHLQNGLSQRQIAVLLIRDQSVISREISRNSSKRGYRFKQAQEKAVKRRVNASSSPSTMIPSTISLIEEAFMDNDSSPVQISGRLKKEHGINVSPQSIYAYIWNDKKAGGALYLHLRRKGKKYNKRKGKKAGRGLIPNRVDIDERPAVVEAKERFGDFELDTIIGAHHRGAIMSAVDRASKFTFLVLLQHANVKEINAALYDRLHVLAKNGLLHTYTSDNGKEFSGHEEITANLGGLFFFAKPYHSWERGLNEHTNGLVRQYFPKGTDFTKLTHNEVGEVERKLNNRPRKILDFKTPSEVFFELNGSIPGDAFQG